MAEAMLSLLIDKEKRLQLSNNSHQRVIDNFSIQAMVAKYTEVYDSLGFKRK